MAVPIEKARWVASLEATLLEDIAPHGAIHLEELVARAERMVLRYTILLRRPFDDLDNHPRESQFALAVSDDVSTQYADLGGGFDVTQLRCAGTREIRPSPPANANLLRLQVTRRGQKSPAHTLQILLPRSAE